MSDKINDSIRGRSPNFSAAVSRRAERTKCPKCGRKGAIRRWSDDFGVYRDCRWCGYSKTRTWDEIYADAEARGR